MKTLNKFKTSCRVVMMKDPKVLYFMTFQLFTLEQNRRRVQINVFPNTPF